jgi:hypothetical protein
MVYVYSRCRFHLQSVETMVSVQYKAFNLYHDHYIIKSYAMA